MGDELMPQAGGFGPPRAPARPPRRLQRRRFPAGGGEADELLVVEHLYRELLVLVEDKLDSGEDLDLADAIANAEPTENEQQVCMRLSADQLERLGGWFVERSAYFERAYIEVANRAAAARTPD